MDADFFCIRSHWSLIQSRLTTHKLLNMFFECFIWCNEYTKLYDTRFVTPRRSASILPGIKTSLMGFHQSFDVICAKHVLNIFKTVSTKIVQSDIEIDISKRNRCLVSKPIYWWRIVKILFRHILIFHWVHEAWMWTFCRYCILKMNGKIRLGLIWTNAFIYRQTTLASNFEGSSK